MTKKVEAQIKQLKNRVNALHRQNKRHIGDLARIELTEEQVDKVIEFVLRKSGRIK